MPQSLFQWLTNEQILVLAIGVLLGDAISKLISQFVDTILSPIVRRCFGDPKKRQPYIKIFGVKIRWREFVIQLVEFLIVVLIVYFLSRRGRLYGAGAAGLSASGPAGSAAPGDSKQGADGALGSVMAGRTTSGKTHFSTKSGHLASQSSSKRKK